MNKNKIKNYIIEKQNHRFEYIIAGKIPLIIKDNLISDIDILDLIKRIETALPNISRYLVDSIIVADLDAFKENKTNALYHDNKIYVSNYQDDLSDMLDDIVHEYSHALEDKYGKEIYFDRSIKDEFISKRLMLRSILQTEYPLDKYNFNKIEYDKEFDKLLLNVVGYERFNNLTKHGLFINPYAATSLREYFATGFEEYVLGDHKELETISPKLYKKIFDIMQIL
tara:strand:+ start:80 stop:757 length:678 start_codon:yes stop_codon:yes gene_type:complete